jgi:TM2 domain-containing membrane protein YozV
MRLMAGMVLVFLTVASSRASADPSAPPPPASAPAPAYAPPPSYGQAPPAYAPPPGYAQPPGYGSSWSGGPAYSPGPDPNAMFVYEAQRKSSAVAVLLSLLVPGVGNIYADHAIGAVITWALIIGGVVVAANSVHNTTDSTTGYGYSANSSSVNSGELTVGIFMFLGGFVYSPIDAYFACESYNHALAQRLGLPMGFVLGPAPIHTDRSVGWGPSLSFRF